MMCVIKKESRLRDYDVNVPTCLLFTSASELQLLSRFRLNGLRFCAIIIKVSVASTSTVHIATVLPHCCLSVATVSPQKLSKGISCAQDLKVI